MKVKIYVRAEDLPELHNFENSVIPYQHRISYNYFKMNFMQVEVIVDYNVFVALEDFTMKSTEE